MKTLKIPKVTQLKNGKVYLTVYVNNKRLRLYSGSSFGIDINPNQYEPDKRIEIANLLSFQIAQVIDKGVSPMPYNKRILEHKSLTDLECLREALKSKKLQAHSLVHTKTLEYVFSLISEAMHPKNTLSQEIIFKVLDKYDNATSYNTIRAYIINLCNEATRFGLSKDVSSNISKKTQYEKLHKPIKSIHNLLDEIKLYNYNLYVCCLLTYGCLLRPHREVRELKWGDFSEDLNYIRLSGNRNKSGRNRIVPVPYYVKEVLKKREDHLNIFTGKEEPFSPDYFKGIWSKFKKRSKILEDNQTLYSFRHTGAISVYKKTGSIEKLKAAMGHSNIMVSLTYLRGLDVAELQEEDMPLLGPVKL